MFSNLNYEVRTQLIFQTYAFTVYQKKKKIQAYASNLLELAIF